METALQQCNADRKRLSKEIGGERGRGEESAELEDRVRGIGDEIAELVRRTAEAEERQRDLLLNIPNLPHADAPVGKDASRQSRGAQLGRETAIRWTGSGSRRARGAAASCSTWNAPRN